MTTSQDSNRGYLRRERFERLLEVLREQGYTTLAPTERDGAMVYAEVAGVSDLKHGLVDEQAPGHYRLHPDDNGRWFDFAVGPQGLKPMSFAPREPLWRVTRDADGRMSFHEASAEALQPTAVIGVRACDLAALALQDQHFLHGPYRDPYYAARRETLLLVSVNCARPAATCFCASTRDGPHAREGFDLGLTELTDGFLVRAGSNRGVAVLAELELESVSEAHAREEDAQARDATAAQQRRLPGHRLLEPLFANLEHPRWDDVAARCLACGNCTSVCPTCFCHAETELVSGEGSEHSREWDSCFSERHAYMHGYKVRPHVGQRYRQWLTHKLGSWHQQYGRSGCVGCGRCIAWCPVGIDLTEEAAVICAGEGS